MTHDQAKAYQKALEEELSSYHKALKVYDAMEKKAAREDDKQQLKNIEELRRRDNGFIHQAEEELKEVAGLAR